MTKARCSALMLWLSAGLAAGVQGQALTPPDGVAFGSSWAYPSPYTQMVSGSASIGAFQLIVNAQQTTGAAYHQDVVIELISPNGTTLLLGGDSAGTTYPGSVTWAGHPHVGTIPNASSGPQAINVMYEHNFGPVAGQWSFNFRNQYTGGSVPWNDIQIVLLTADPGACCLGDGTCTVTTPVTCASMGGTYQTTGSTCSSVTCPQPGACCMPNTTCTYILQSLCLGAFQGAGVPCTTCVVPPGTWAEQGDAGELPLSAQVTQGTGALSSIVGDNGPSDTDMYRIRIADPSNFSATTVNGAIWDTILYLFDANGYGIVTNDDAVSGLVQSTLTSQFVSGLPAGDYNLAIVRYSRRAQAAGLNIFPTTFPGEFGPTGPGGSMPVDGWSGTTTAGGEYTIFMTGVEFAVQSGPTCYANCDGSTIPPILNVADFTCFLQKFAAGDAYANCDGSTVPPVLNVADFTCFLQKFAAGCR